MSQVEILDLDEEFNLPSTSTAMVKHKKYKNKITSPPHEKQSPISTNNTKISDITNLFTIKEKSRLSSKKNQSEDSSELSDDVFIKSVKNLKTYRDKINDRFKIVKTKAQISTRKAKVKDSTKIERIRSESNDIDLEIQTVKKKFHLNNREKLRKCDFFTVETNQIQEPIINETNDSTENLIQDVNIEFVYPETLDFLIELSEKEHFFQPNSKPVELNQKIDTSEVRIFEEEGLYVPKFPNLSQRKLNLLEQRLLDDKKWFNSEGKLKIMENPLRKPALRPELTPLPIQDTTIFLPAKIKAENEFEEIVILNENILELKITTLKFLHHPLFNIEHVLHQKLENLVKEHKTNLKCNKIKKLSNKLEALRHIRKEHEIEEKQEEYKTEIKQIQEMLFEENKKDRQRIKAILETWKLIKQIREMNQYSTTTSRLVIHRQLNNFEEETEEYKQNLNEFLKEATEADKHRIKERYKECFRPPGEPILDFTLANDNEITEKIEDNDENLRRNVILSTKIQLKIICNNLQVCKTKSVYLNEVDFTCNFNQCFSILLVNIPKFLVIEIYEQSVSFSKRKIGECSIDLPMKKLEIEKTLSVRFEKQEIIHYKHKGVGSGVKFNSILNKYKLKQINDDSELNTTGQLSYSVNWVNFIKEDTYELKETRLFNEIIDKNGVINREKLNEWLTENKFDPQDPRNATLYESLDFNPDLTINNQKKVFRLNPFIDKFQFCSVNEIEKNIRLKILQLRNNNEPEFDGMIVPNRIKDIPLNILTDYKRRMENEKDNFQIIDEEDEDADDFGEKCLKQIQIRIFQKCKNTENNLTYEDVIDEKILLNFEKFLKVIIDNIINWFRWRPKFTQPLPKLRNIHVNISTEIARINVKIIMRIVGALNIPRRADNKESQTFVQINYNNITSKTSLQSGPSPIWNEELHLPIERTHLDYLNPNSLSGAIILDIFDENESMNWLGFLEIPLSAICYCSNMEGFFKLKMPNLCLNYENDVETSQKLPKLKPIYVNLQISIEPNVPKLRPSIEELPCGDLPYLKEHILKWKNSFNTSFPHRRFSAFVIDINGLTHCLTKFIKPLEPPQLNISGFNATPEQCLRFLSLIRFTTNSNQFYHNICLTTEQFLRLNIGTIVDHAIALVCYLLALKLDVWLLFGFGIPHGFTAFVLQKSYNEDSTVKILIYDVVYGEMFEIVDPFCPLQQIFCLINENNIWANLQRTDNINITRFDLNRKSDWWALFNKHITAPSASVQNPVCYRVEMETIELEIQLDKKIRKKFSKLRQLERTVWNQQISKIFKNCLKALENSLMFDEKHEKLKAFNELEECKQNYLIKGHCINLPYKNFQTTFKTVKSFGIHLDEGNNPEFGLAVYLKSYPNKVLTFWIFIASISKRL